MKANNRYNDITAQDVEDFNNREVIYNSTQSSTLGSENAILTLENERVFYDKRNLFFERLNTSKFKDYKPEDKYNLFYKFVLNFLDEHKNESKGINYVFEKALLNELKEASILMFNECTETV